MYTVDVQMSQDTRTLYFTCNDLNTIKNLYAALAGDTRLPKIETASVSDGNYTGIYQKIERDKEVLYIPYGRYFTAEEIDSGADVALLGTDFIKSLPKANIDNILETGIDIGGRHFNAIGNYLFDFPKDSIDEGFYECTAVPTTVMIPLKTYFNLGLVPSRFRCVFSRSLSGAEITYLSGLLQPFGKIQSLSLPKPNEARAVSSYINGISTYIAVLILSLISAVSVILYWLRKEFARYRIYLIYGAKGRQIAYFISLNVALLVTVTYIIAYFAVYAITKITPQGIVSPMPWRFYVLIYLGVMIFMQLAVNIRAIPIVFREKMLQNRRAKLGCCFNRVQTPLEEKACKFYSNRSNIAFDHHACAVVRHNPRLSG